MADYKRDVYYELKLSKSVKHGATWLRPNQKVVVLGSVVPELGDAVDKATEVKKKK